MVCKFPQVGVEKNMGLADSMSEYNGEPLNSKVIKHKYHLNGFSKWEA